MQVLSKGSETFNPLVSILIPCYNAERWIRQCIQSALDQTWENKEVIVIDDGSTDSSVREITSFGDRIRFQASAHSGANAIRNQLAQLASGEWLQYLDADDWLRPGKLATQLAAVRASRQDVAVVYSPVIVHETENSGAERLLEIKDTDDTLTFIRWGSLNTGGLLLNREAVVRAGAWKPDQPCCQEHELLLRLRVAGGRFLFVNAAEAMYRHHSPSTVSKRDPLLTIRTRMGLTDKMEEYLKSSGQFTDSHRKALFAARMECARSAYSRDADLAQELCRQAEAHGREWVQDSPALPLGYQISVRLAGFLNTERLAAWARRTSSPQYA
jgi:glycosyltransferase involved in cell wall biosynthesis